MSPSLLALLGFIAWTLLLLVLMEVLRTRLVVTGRVPANGFDPGNSRLSPFMQRLARAHAKGLAGLPIFGGLLLLAVVAGMAAMMVVLFHKKMLGGFFTIVGSVIGAGQPK